MATHHPSTAAALTDIAQNLQIGDAVALLRYISEKVIGSLTIDTTGVDTSHDVFESDVKKEADIVQTPNHLSNVSGLQSEFLAIAGRITPPLFKTERDVLEKELENIYTDVTKRIIIASDPTLILQLINLQKDIESASPNLGTIGTKVIGDIIQGDNVMDIEVTNPFNQECRIKDESGNEHILPRGVKNIQVPISGTSRIGNTVSYTLQFFDPNDRAKRIDKKISSRVQEELLQLKTPDISHPNRVKMGTGCQSTFNNPVDGSKVVIKDSTGTVIQSFDGSSSRNFEIDSRYLNTLGRNDFQAVMIDPKGRIPGSAPFDFSIGVEINDDALQIDNTLEIENGQPINIPIRGGTRGALVSVMNGSNDIADRATLSGTKNETIPLKTTGLGAIDTKKPGEHKVNVSIADPHTGKTREEIVTIKIKETPLKLSSSPQFSSNLSITKGDSSLQVGLKGPVEKGAELVLNGAGLSDFRYIVTSRITSGAEEIIDLDGITATSTQTVRAYFRDPNTDKKSGNGGFTIQVKEALEHKDEPDFSITEYTPGGDLPEVELRNVPKNGTFEIDYPRTTGSTSIVRRNTGASVKQKLQDFDESGTGVDVTVHYKDSAGNIVSSATKRIKRKIAPPLEKPEGMPESVEITKDSRRVTIGKMKPGQKLPASLTIKGAGTDVITVTPLESADGTRYFDLPKNYDGGTTDLASIKHTLSFNVTGGGHAPLVCPMDINVRIPPTKLEVIDTHQLDHALDEALKKKKAKIYNIKGVTGDFVITPTRTWYGRKKVLTVEVPDGHGGKEKIHSSDKEEIKKKVKEKLSSINDHNLYAYNVANGIVTERPETPQDKKEEAEKGKEGKEKGEKDKSDHKDDKGHDDHKSEGGTKYDKVVNTIFGNGIIGKTFKGARNMIPKGIRGLTGAAFDGAVAGTVIGGGLYLTGAALGSAAIGSLVVPATGLAFAGYGLYSAGKRFMKWRASRGGGESKGGGH